MRRIDCCADDDYWWLNNLFTNDRKYETNDRGKKTQNFVDTTTCQKRLILSVDL